MKKILSFLLFGSFALFYLTSCEDDDPAPRNNGDVSITGIEADAGFSDDVRIYTKAGAVITITGEGFDETAANNEVSIGGEILAASSASPTSISVAIPEVGLLQTITSIEVSVGGQSEEFDILMKVFPENTVFVPNGDLDGASWTNDNVYLIDGYVFVQGDLEIEEGTVVMATTDPFANDNASSLIITREGTINAEGTPEEPIIFTSESDQESLGGEINLDGSDTKGWAGLIILGEAGIGAGAPEVQIEGLPDGEDRALYGGDNDEDNSGVLKYVSIRFSGAEIGPGDEIQGLTLGGVGSGTTIEYVDIFASSDDGIEIFGGSVAIRYISVAFAEDDAFDFDLGWNGYGQFLFGIQRADDADHAGEWDGASPDDHPRYVNARIYNATLLGRGFEEATEDESGSQAIVIRDGGAVSLYNSIVGDFKRRAIQIEDRDETEDSYDKFVNQGINEIAGNLFFALSGNAFVPSDEEGSLVLATPAEEDVTPADANAAEIAALLAASNIYLDADALNSISREQGGGSLDPRPAVEEAEADLYAPTVEAANGDDYEEVAYKGAFAPEADMWISGWSTLSRFGYLAE